MITSEHIGQRLRVAREQASFSQADVAGELGVTAAAVSQYESGKRRIDAVLLDRLCRLYGVPAGFVLEGVVVIPDWEAALRARQQALSQAGKAGISLLIQKVRDFEDLHRGAKAPYSGQSHHPFKPLPARRFTDTDIVAWAEKARRHFGVGIAPLTSLREFLEAHGYHIFSVTLGSDPEDLSGLFFQHREFGPVIVINEDRAYTRRPFTMAHELAHALFHYDRAVVDCRGRSQDPLERFANHFASHFLVPDEALDDLLRNWGCDVVTEPEQIIHLARYFGISYGAMERRLEISRRVKRPGQGWDDPRPAALAKNLGYSVSAYELGERPLLLEDRFPRAFIDLTLNALKREQISLRRAAELLDISYLELEELLEAPEVIVEQPDEAYV